MKMRKIMLAVAVLFLMAGCGGGTKKKASEEMTKRVNDAVEELKYLDQIAEVLTNARVWEVQNKPRIVEMTTYISQKKVVNPAKQTELPDIPALIDPHTFAQPSAMNEADHANLMGIVDAYYSAQQNYATKAIELSQYIVNSEYRKDRFKKGQALVEELNATQTTYRDQGLKAWSVLQTLQKKSTDRMQNHPLAASYQVVAQDVFSYKIVIDLVINYLDQEGELQEAVDQFNKSLESVYANRMVGEEELRKAGKKQLFDTVYLELNRGYKVLKDIILALKEEKEPLSTDVENLNKRFEAIHVAYKNFLNG